MAITSKTFAILKDCTNLTSPTPYSDNYIDILFDKLYNWVENKQLYKVFRFIIDLFWKINKLISENEKLKLEIQKLKEENTKTNCKCNHTCNSNFQIKF